MHGDRKRWCMAGRIVARIASVLVASLTAAAHAQDRPWEWGWHPMHSLWAMWGLGMLLVMLTFWVLVIVALVAGIRWLMRQGREPRSDPALEILRQRYA